MNHSSNHYSGSSTQSLSTANTSPFKTSFVHSRNTFTSTPYDRTFGDSSRIVCHSSHALAFLFGDPIAQHLFAVHDSRLGPFYYGYNISKLHAQISAGFIQYLTNFVRFGDPNVRSQHFGAQSPKYSSQSQPQQQQSTPFWPSYNSHQKAYLSLGNLYPKPFVHYDNHRLSLWLNMIPRLLIDDRVLRTSDSNQTRPMNGLRSVIESILSYRNEQNRRRYSNSVIENSRQSSDTLPYSQHHLLLEHANRDAFDGSIRTSEQLFKSQNSKTFQWISNGSNEAGNNSNNSSTNYNSSSTNNFAQNKTGNGHQNSTSLVRNNSINNNSAEFSLHSPMDDSAKFAQTNTGNGNTFELFRSTVTGSETLTNSNALVITVAVGSALLFFNICIFAALYYQLDRNRKLVATIKQQQQTKNDQKVCSKN